MYSTEWKTTSPRGTGTVLVPGARIVPVPGKENSTRIRKRTIPVPGMRMVLVPGTRTVLVLGTRTVLEPGTRMVPELETRLVLSPQAGIRESALVLSLVLTEQ